ncbi:MAG: Fic family protein [Muribaculaceae bacterium]|nr:Fic family protein [Roseburia sp.]MCM1431503.1 Fic family protein [Muribaculaceae bacterium]MCM1493202.1 Fic family protein [Muribaculaceae bacterium]
MDYQKLLRKKELYDQCRASIPEFTLFTFEQAFEIEYTHNSTAIEGNTLSLIETRVLLEDGISIGGKNLREIYEAVNHRKAYCYVKDCIRKGLPLDEKIVKDIHAILMENILTGGVYRDVQVYISGAQHMPPPPGMMYQQVKNFYADLQWKGKELNQMELAAWTHAEFVRIHPFQDGNGRTSRLIMNYQLMSEGFPAISVAKEDRLEYFKALDVYAAAGSLQPFADMVAGLVEGQMEKYIEISESQRN